MKFCKKCACEIRRGKCCCAAIAKLPPSPFLFRMLGDREAMESGDQVFGWHPIPKHWIGKAADSERMIQRQRNH